MGVYLLCLPVMAFVGLLSLVDFLRSPWMSKTVRGRYLTLAAFGVVASSAMIWAVLIRDIVPSPYMVSSSHPNSLVRYLTMCRTKSSTFPRPSSTARVGSLNGTR